MKSKNDFDGFIRQRMENFEAEGRPKGWDLLADRLEEEDAGTAAADEKVLEAVIFEKMSQMESAYQPSHWVKLENRLNEEYRFVNKIIRYKSLELSIFLLLIAFFVNYYPETPIQENVPLKTQKAIAAEIKENPKSLASSEPVAISEAELNRSTAAQAQPEDQLPEIPVSTDLVPGNATPVPGAMAGKQKAKATAAKTEIGSLSATYIIPPLPLPSYALAKTPVLSLGGSELSNSLEQQAFQAILSTETSLLDQNLLASIHPLPDLTILPKPSDEIFIGEVKPSPKERFMRFGMHSSMDYNRVITPPIRFNGKTYSEDRYALGYSGGLTVSWGTNRREIEMGLIYMSKKYLPLRTGEFEFNLQNGPSGEELKTFEYDMVSIPLNMRYHFITDGKWRFYVIGGISMNTVLQADYFITSLSEPPQPGPPPSNFNPPPNNNGTKAGIAKAAFTKGLFQDGPFSKNTYFTANIGVGLERFISHRTSLFAQPHYQHTFLFLNQKGGVGPFNDKLHTMSLIFGMRVKL